MAGLAGFPDPAGQLPAQRGVVAVLTALLDDAVSHRAGLDLLLLVIAMRLLGPVPVVADLRVKFSDLPTRGGAALEPFSSQRVVVAALAARTSHVPTQLFLGLLLSPIPLFLGLLISQPHRLLVLTSLGGSEGVSLGLGAVRAAEEVADSHGGAPLRGRVGIGIGCGHRGRNSWVRRTGPAPARGRAGSDQKGGSSPYPSPAVEAPTGAAAHGSSAG